MLTLQFVPYSEIERLNSEERIDRLLHIVKDDKIVLMQGRLRPEEEILMIQETMAAIEERFKGIELCTIFPEEKNIQFFNRVRKSMAKALLGNRDGITIIGPTSVVKEIKRDPNKLQLFTITPRLSGVSRRRTRASSRRSSARTLRRRVSARHTRRR